MTVILLGNDVIMHSWLKAKVLWLSQNEQWDLIGQRLMHAD